MGMIWSSPYHWQIIQVGLGLLILVLGFVFLLISIGLEEVTWRIVGVILISLGTALSIFGTCWCVCAVRSRSSDESLLNPPEAEAETLTSDVAWQDPDVGTYVVLDHSFLQDILDPTSSEATEYQPESCAVDASTDTELHWQNWSVYKLSLHYSLPVVCCKLNKLRTFTDCGLPFCCHVWR